MNNLTTEIKMTSLDLVDLTGKEHNHIMRDIRTEIKDLGKEIGRSIFGLMSYKDGYGREQPRYVFGRKGAMQLALKYEAKVRFRVIERLEELENKNKEREIDSKFLFQVAQQLEEKEKQITLMKPKADYTDTILKSKSLVNISQIAKDYGMSGTAMNDLLHDLKVQYYQGQWLLYKDFQDEGYTSSATMNITRTNGIKDSRMRTKWTQKGRLFIYDLLKEKDILPTIENSVEQLAIKYNV